MQPCWDLLIQPDSREDRQDRNSWNVTFGNAQATWNDHYRVFRVVQKEPGFCTSFLLESSQLFYHADEHIWLLPTPQTCLQMIVAVCLVQQMFINGLECSLHQLREVLTPAEMFYIELKLTWSEHTHTRTQTIL